MDFGLPTDEDRILRLVLDGPRNRAEPTKKLDVDRLVGDDAEPLLRNLVRDEWLRPLMGTSQREGHPYTAAGYLASARCNHRVRSVGVPARSRHHLRGGVVQRARGARLPLS